MILSVENILFYLLERGLVTPESAVDGDLIIAEASSRNRNFKVMRRRHPAYFVKQIQQWDAQSIALLQREASCYWLAHQEQEFAPLAALIPGYHGYDAARHTLVVELLSGAENLSEYHRRLRVFPVDVAGLLGHALGACHASVNIDNPRVQNGGFPKTAPWILAAHQINQLPTQTSQSVNKSANKEVLQIIQKYTQFHPLLDRLREQWQVETLIHGDIKWDNCILCQQDDGQRIKLVDWETADLGDPAWDVGAIFQAYLIHWIMSIPIRPDTPPAHFEQLAPQPIEAMHPALRAYWHAYLDARQLEGPAGRTLLTRSVQYGAARMLQTAYEYMVHSPQISGNALCMLQVSLNILSQPQDAIHELLGFA